MMITTISSLGHQVKQFIMTLGASGLFLLSLLFKRPRVKFLWPECRMQIYALGVLSFLIIVVSGLFIGMVVGLQGFHTLQKFGATSQLGQLVALSMTRELSPVMAALLFAGRAGSSLTAEIGLMKATEQLSSMSMMGVDPFVRVVYPRFIAGFISLPILTLIFSFMGIWGGAFVGVDWLGIDAGTFWSNMQTAVDFKMDIWSGIVKSIVFAFIIVWVSLYQGMACDPTSQGISQATTKTVVYASLIVLAMDFLLTALMIGGW
jgi:phospholipid/cholesterol/gamma-HCH transport system permease protein